MITQPDHKKAFTLIELLVVIALMAMIAAVSVPALASLMKSGQINYTVSEMGGLLEQARQYAVAQNTYVWVTFNSSTNTSANVNELSVAVMASKDGMQPDVWDPNSTNLTLISKVKTFRQVQLTEPGVLQLSNLPSTGISSANALSSDSTFPLNIKMGGTVANFNRGVLFTPSGGVRNNANPIDVLEFGLQSARVVTASPDTNNIAVVRLNGLTGQTRVYRRL